VLVPQTPLSRTVAPYSTGPAGVIGTATGVSRFIPDTNAIESLNARFRKAVRHRGHFPNEQSALKVLYLVATEKRPNRSNPTGRINSWKKILNALTIHYGDRIQADN
jgi:transposase-like protein